MTTIIKQLREETRNRFPTFPVEGEHQEMTDGVFIPDVEHLMDFIIHIHNSAITIALESLPKEFSEEESPLSYIPWNACRAETEKKLRSLLVTETS